VAYRGPQRLGVVAFNGGTASTLVSGNALGDFLWSPASSGLYFVDSSAVKFVARGGGTPLTLATVPGQQLRLWSVDGQDQTLFGSRYDDVTRTYRIFKLDTGGGVPLDIVLSALSLDEARIDPSGSWLLYRAFFPSPFTPREYFRTDPFGGNTISLTGGEIGGNPEHALWLDEGQSVVLGIGSPSTGVPQLGRIDVPSTQITMLTDGFAARRNHAHAAGTAWLAVQAQYPTGAGPAVIPPQGGGLVFLDPDNRFYLFQGPPSVDATGDKIAFAAAILGSSVPPQVYAVSLDRELRVTPRLVTGQSFNLRLPLAAPETGMVLAGVATVAQPFPIPGFGYGLALDPVLILPVATGGPVSGALSATLNVPNDSGLVGASLYLQGLRWNASFVGAFTSYVEARIF
jgi:hypothetical protein